MFIPKVNPSQSDILASLSYLGDLFLESLPTSPSFSPTTSYWLPANSIDEAIELLDQGAAKIVVDAQIASECDDIPIDRLAVLVGSVKEAAIVIEKVSVVIVEGDEDTARDIAALSKEAGLLPCGGELRVVLGNVEEISVEKITALDRDNIDVLVAADRLTTSLQPEPHKINIARAYLASATTDRPDGLFATVVTDERNVCLGLVYSSAESLSEALRTGTGVYQSRKHGLWYKGATSGATQQLVRVTLDCDRDALKFTVKQAGQGFCHLNTRSCFSTDRGLSALEQTLLSRRQSAPAGSYTSRLFSDPSLLRAKIMEEAEELCEAKTKEEIAWEAADLLYFAMTKVVSAGLTLDDVEQRLDAKARKITRRPGNAKEKWQKVVEKTEAATEAKPAAQSPAPIPTPARSDRIAMRVYRVGEIGAEQRAALLKRPIIQAGEIMSRVTPIIQEVRSRGDAALLDLTAKFDGVRLDSPVLRAPFDPRMMELPQETRDAIDQAYENVWKFHEAQLEKEPMVVETMPGVVCTRFVRPIERVGLYVPGGTAVLPSSTIMLGVPARVAGCKEIVIATPPSKQGTVAPEVLYVAHKVGASTVLLAGGAQAVAAMAYGTESVPKVDKICGPGNQYVTAAKMLTQTDSESLVAIDMPAGPSEVLVVADATAVPKYVASDLLSQAEHGVDSQVVLIAVGLDAGQLAAIEDEVHEQALRLPRVEIVRQSIAKSYTLCVQNIDEAVQFSNAYAPEHLILHVANAESLLPKIDNAGSVFVGPYSPESCGDYASGTNHTLPTYGYARMYSGVNTHTFVKHITSQQLSAEGLLNLGDTVMRLAEVEGLDAHRNAVAVRLEDLRK
ncbi:uncharacterized protein VTP21DRAFT_3916 [Calcarisporiella thermophila]|uniref:uncharacterized protein n=1 Tax=Calcarisporiella thermophila TaxID=911321 RepID=UPI0037449819